MEEFQEQEYEFLRKLDEDKLDRRRLLKRGLAAGAGLTILSTPAAAFAARQKALAAPPLLGRSISLAEIVKEAKKEGQLNVIALPHDWSNYGEVISTFKKKYGLKVDEQNDQGSSAQENQALRDLKGDSRAPDVVDVSPPFAIDGANEGLYARYYTTNFRTVPRSQRIPRSLSFSRLFSRERASASGNSLFSTI